MFTKSTVGTVYLVHLANGWHYIGFSVNLPARIEKHKATRFEAYPDGPRVDADGIKRRGKKIGEGATLLGLANSNGIAWEVVRTWPNVTISTEYKLKSWNGSKRFCPTCRGPVALLCANYTD